MCPQLWPVCRPAGEHEGNLVEESIQVAHDDQEGLVQGSMLAKETIVLQLDTWWDGLLRRHGEDLVRVTIMQHLAECETSEQARVQ